MVQNQKLIKLSDDLSIAVSAARNINASYLTTFGDAINLYQEDLSARLMNSSATRSLPYISSHEASLRLEGVSLLLQQNVARDERIDSSDFQVLVSATVDRLIKHYLFKNKTRIKSIPRFFDWGRSIGLHTICVELDKDL